MSVSAAPRAASVVQEEPLRYPDGSPATMARRGWWLVIMNFLLPGSAQAAAGNRRLAKIGLGATLLLWAVVLIGLLLLWLWRPAVVTLATNWFVLLLAQVLLVGYAILWVVLSLDTLRMVRLVRLPGAAKIGVALLAVVLMVLSAGTAAYAAQIVGATRATIGSIFGNSGPAVEPSDGYYNILLLGADSGEGRDSMRFDSISVVSVNADTGAVTITGIPREMPGAPFSEGSPMLAQYPNGFEGHGDPVCGWSDYVNHVRHAVEVCAADNGVGLYPDAASRGSAPGIEATKDIAEGILGIEIPYYVFIDMKGFADLIDALGGVEITVEERLPKGGGPAFPGQEAEEWAIGWIEAGTQHMDGDTAQWYARSRYTTSDYDRMLRQRQLQEAMLAQFTPANVLARFNDIARAGSDVVSTDIPQSMISYFVELAIKARELPVATIELTPDGGISETDPDYVYVRELVRQTLHPEPPEGEGQ